jgi:hypothetical protein
MANAFQWRTGEQSIGVELQRQRDKSTMTTVRKDDQNKEETITKFRKSITILPSVHRLPSKARI